MTKQERNPKRSPAELLADNLREADAAARKAELRRAAIHMRSAKLEADMGEYADAAVSLRLAADIYDDCDAGETVEIDAE